MSEDKQSSRKESVSSDYSPLKNYDTHKTHRSRAPKPNEGYTPKPETSDLKPANPPKKK